MPLYAKIVSGAVERYKEYKTLDTSAVRHINGEPMLRLVVDTDPPYNSNTEVKTGPVVTINPTLVSRVWTVRAKNAGEIDADKDAEIDRQQRVLLKIILNHENRIRDLESKTPITMAQLKTAIKGLL